MGNEVIEEMIAEGLNHVLTARARGVAILEALIRESPEDRARETWQVDALHALDILRGEPEP